MCNTHPLFAGVGITVHLYRKAFAAQPRRSGVEHILQSQASPLRRRKAKLRDRRRAEQAFRMQTIPES
jgi:hypothetical protein